MRCFTAAAAGIVLALSACIDADMEATVLGADHARVDGHIQVERQMYDMFGGGEEFCPRDEGGTIALTDAHARCNITRTGTFAEIFEPAGEGAPVPVATDLGDGTVHVAFPLGDMVDEGQQMGHDPNTIAMFRPMLQGRSVVLRISGAEIVSSTGAISSDRTTATLKIALTDLIDRPQEIPQTFEAVVRY